MGSRAGSAAVSVAPGVFRIPLPHPTLLFSNSYLIVGEPNVLIDPGHFSSVAQDQLRRALNDLRVPARSVCRLMLTDATPERAGGLVAPDFHKGAAKVLAHRGLVHQIGDYGAYSLQYRRELILPTFEDARLYQRLDLSSLDAVLNQSYRVGGQIAVDTPLHSGSVIELGGPRKLQVIETPGATANQLSFWMESDKLLFSGNLGSHEGRELPVMIRGMGGSLDAFRSSVKLLAALPARMLLPANGEPVPTVELAWARLGKIALQHRENLRAMLLAGPRELATLFDLMVLGHGLSQIRFVQKVATIRVALADLVASGDVEELREDRVLFYRLTPRALRSSRLKRA